MGCTHGCSRNRRTRSSDGDGDTSSAGAFVRGCLCEELRCVRLASLGQRTYRTYEERPRSLVSSPLIYLTTPPLWLVDEIHPSVSWEPLSPVCTESDTKIDYSQTVRQLCVLCVPCGNIYISYASTLSDVKILDYFFIRLLPYSYLIPLLSFHRERDVHHGVAFSPKKQSPSHISSHRTCRVPASH